MSVSTPILAGLTEHLAFRPMIVLGAVGWLDRPAYYGPVGQRKWHLSLIFNPARVGSSQAKRALASNCKRAPPMASGSVKVPDERAGQ